MFSATSLTVLARCLEGDAEDWNEVIQGSVGRSHSKRWANEKARKLEEVLDHWKGINGEDVASITVKL
ncbi:hypothetical protein AAXB25_33995 [Paenibacillus lautus]|uniref:hypothetical protein n=1 Tax=Paenibacillus lautus TaxID=1401 RepID=UPI003D284992